MINNDFDKELKYNLYRSIKEILHPTISKRNISDYKIVVEDSLMPLRVFYPKKVSNLENIMIYIHGEGKLTECSGKYTNILSKASVNYNQLIISLDYESYKELKLLDLYDKFYETFKYIYFELLNNGISYENITLAGDSIGASAILSIINKIDNDKIKINKQILFYPLVSGEYFTTSSFPSINESSAYNRELLKKIAAYYKKKTSKKSDLNNKNLFALKGTEFNHYPKTLIICGNADILIDEARKLNEILKDKSTLVEVPFAFHGFIRENDEGFNKDYQNKINLFLNR